MRNLMILLGIAIAVLLVRAFIPNDLGDRPTSPDKGVGVLQERISDYLRTDPDDAAAKRTSQEAIAEDVKRLIDEGADVNYRSTEAGAVGLLRGMTPLHMAVYVNAPRVVSALLEEGASLDIKDANAGLREEGAGNVTPLELARRRQEKVPELDYSAVIQRLEAAKRQREDTR